MSTETFVWRILMKVKIETIYTKHSCYWRIIWYTRPLGWWYHRIIGGIGYNLSQQCILGDTCQAYFVRIYYKYLNRMLAKYKINWYGIPDYWG